jgi:hypothetical protein
MIHNSSRFIPVRTTASGKIVRIAIRIQPATLSSTVLSAMLMLTGAVIIQMHNVINAILQEGVIKI